MLVLSLHLENVSPQFHFQVNDSFASVMGSSLPFIPKSEWQVKAKFKNKKHALPATDISYQGPIIVQLCILTRMLRGTYIVVFLYA
jgi:hypothetical protein